ncbi:MAG: hypothetical protein IT381_02245 [Deltaproteobacteria bacterium]|nr:hypothetical protein [Deltaproteobacteria bacterium]
MSSQRKPSAMGTAALNLLRVSPDLVVQLILPMVPDGSRDTELVAAVGLALARLERAPEAARWFLRLFELMPEDVEVCVCLAEAAMEAADPAMAVTALERAFAIDKAAATPAGRRARVLAFKLEKQLGER